jgi:hypothetical protein
VIKRPRREADHISTTGAAEALTARNYTSTTPYVFIVLYSGTTLLSLAAKNSDLAVSNRRIRTHSAP